MKKMLLLTVIITSMFFSCTKDSQQSSDTRPDMKGIWIGKWGDNFDTPNNNYRLEVKANSVVNINNGQADYVGSWSVDDYTFVTSYVINGQTLTLKAPINKSHMEGIWRNITTNQYHGTFYLDKQ